MAGVRSPQKPSAATAVNSGACSEAEPKPLTDAGAAEGKTKGKKKNNASAANDGGGDEAEVKEVSLFSVLRVRRLMGKEAGPDTRVSSEAVFIVNKASEMFLQMLAADVHAKAMEKRKRLVDYESLSSAVICATRYEFLTDSVPVKIRAADALKNLEAMTEP